MHIISFCLQHRIPHAGVLCMGILVASVLQGCAGRVRSIDSLGRITAYPQSVTVEGTVGDRVPLVNQYVYELTDASGTIWVQTSTLPPAGQPDQRVKVNGTLQRFSMPELNGGELYIQELSHQTIGQ